MRSYTLWSAGSTGTGNGDSVRGVDGEDVALEIDVSAVGATPTATFVIETSLDGTNFVPVAVKGNDGVAVGSGSVTLTSVGRRVFVPDPTAEIWGDRWRVRVPANTNVTFGVQLHVRGSGTRRLALVRDRKSRKKD